MEHTHKAKEGNKPREGKRRQNQPRNPKDPSTQRQNQPRTSKDPSTLVQNGPLQHDFAKRSGSAEENVGTASVRPVTRQRRAAPGGSESSCDGSPCGGVRDGAVPPGGADTPQSRKTLRRKPGLLGQDHQHGTDVSSGVQDSSGGVSSRQKRRVRGRREQDGQSRGTHGKAPPLCDPTSPSGEEEQEKKRRKKKKGRKPKADGGETAEASGTAHAASQRPQRSQEKSKAQQHGAGSMSSSGCGGRRNRGGRGGHRRVFDDYMSLREVSAGLKRGELIQGPLRINPKKYHEAFIPSPDGSADIFLDGLAARNRALNGDVVVVKLLPPEQWKVENREESELTPPGNGSPGQGKPRASLSPDVIVEAQYSDDDDVVVKMKAVSLQDKVSAKPENAEHMNNGGTSGSASEKVVQRTGKVVYITELKHSRAASGFIKLLPDKTFAMFSPVDHRVPRVNVPLTDCPADFSSRPGDYANTLFICRITHWPADSTFAEGRLAKTLGQAGEIEPETEGILDEYDVECSEFPAEALACLPQHLPWTIPAEELAKRRDLRQECVFTIDPATARDLDDALSCRQLPDGSFEVGVHIADVSYFVEEGNALDLVASRRATSVYLVQKVVPMLPRLLCEELCSLNPQTDRLTFSVIWTLSPKGKILSEWFGRSVICSCVKLSYDHVQSMIDSPEKRFSPEELPPCAPDHSIQSIHQAVLHLHTIAKHLRAQRFEGGALRLDQMKLAFCLDADSGMPQGCYLYQYRDSNKLVEEFMLLANMAVSHRVYQTNPRLALLRRHPPPQGRMMDSLQELCRNIGLHIDLSSSGALHKSLIEAVGDDCYSAARKEVLTHLCSRPMQMAVYFCTGILQDEKLFRHYALNVPLYTHFTSPIRRYADLVVHRLLAASLKCGPRSRLSAEEVHSQASHCNDKKTASKRVQELSTELFFSVFVRECGPLDSEAMVMGMLDKAFDVLVLSYGVQKRIYCNAVDGLQSFHFRKVGKRPEMTLVWTADGPGQEPVRQEISLFSLLHVQLKADAAPLKYSAVLKRPAAPQP